MVVLQEIFGMTEQLKNVTRFWADQGYNTLLQAMYDRISPDMVLDFSDIDTAQEAGKKLQPDTLWQDNKASDMHIDNEDAATVMRLDQGGGAATETRMLLDVKVQVC